MTPFLLALAVTSSTLTAATWRDAAVEWEVIANKERAEKRTALARLEAKKRFADTIAAEADLAMAKAREREADLRLDLLEVETERDARVTRSSRAWSVAGAVACTLGAVAAVAGLTGCESATCREALGIGGGVLAAGGCVALGVSW